MSSACAKVSSRDSFECRILEGNRFAVANDDVGLVEGRSTCELEFHIVEGQIVYIPKFKLLDRCLYCWVFGGYAYYRCRVDVLNPSAIGNSGFK